MLVMLVNMELNKLFIPVRKRDMPNQIHMQFRCRSPFLFFQLSLLPSLTAVKACEINKGVADCSSTCLKSPYHILSPWSLLRSLQTHFRRLIWHLSYLNSLEPQRNNLFGIQNCQPPMTKHNTKHDKNGKLLKFLKALDSSSDSFSDLLHPRRSSVLVRNLHKFGRGMSACRIPNVFPNRSYHNELSLFISFHHNSPGTTKCSYSNLSHILPVMAMTRIRTCWIFIGCSSSTLGDYPTLVSLVSVAHTES